MVSDDGEHEPLLATIEVVPGPKETQSRVVIRGEIDVAISPRLRSTLSVLLAQGVSDLTLDFSAVSFIDSSGLGVLVGALKRVQETDSGSVRIVGATDFVRKIFEITGLHTAFLLDD